MPELNPISQGSFAAAVTVKSIDISNSVRFKKYPSYKNKVIKYNAIAEEMLSVSVIIYPFP